METRTIAYRRPLLILIISAAIFVLCRYVFVPYFDYQAVMLALVSFLVGVVVTSIEF